MKEMEHRKEMLHKAEKPALESKKFKAWLISELLLTSLGVTALVKQPNLSWSLSAFMVAIVFGMIAISMWYLGKQAAVDSAVRGFAMVGKVAGLAGTAVEKIKGKPKKDPPE